MKCGGMHCNGCGKGATEVPAMLVIGILTMTGAVWVWKKVGHTLASIVDTVFLAVLLAIGSALGIVIAFVSIILIRKYRRYMEATKNGRIQSHLRYRDSRGMVQQNSIPQISIPHNAPNPASNAWRNLAQVNERYLNKCRYCDQLGDKNSIILHELFSHETPTVWREKE